MNIFVITIIILDFLAGIFYFVKGDYWRGVYWLTAGILTITTLKMK